MKAEESGALAGFVTETSRVVSVDINTPTLHALSLLVRGGRSAVAVLAPDGTLITNLSSSDLRCGPEPDNSFSCTSPQWPMPTLCCQCCTMVTSAAKGAIDTPLSVLCVCVCVWVCPRLEHLLSGCCPAHASPVV